MAPLEWGSLILRLECSDAESVPITPSARRHVIGLVATLAVALAGTGVACSPQGAGGLTQRLSVATGGTGGVYYPYGGGVAKVISDHLDGVEATAEVTAGTVDNLKFIANREADLAFALADSLDDAAAAPGRLRRLRRRAGAGTRGPLRQPEPAGDARRQGHRDVADLRDRIERPARQAAEPRSRRCGCSRGPG